LAKIPRIVVDTNTFVSAIIGNLSTPAKAVEAALASGTLLRSIDTWNELEDVLMRSKFDRYCAANVRKAYLDSLDFTLESVSVHTTLAVCRHTKDDKFLALALDGNAHVILTGDADLLVLHPFRGISIVNPADYLSLPGR
jgi:putative PIN family toxin of toxin-antitoxin system